VAEPCCSEKGQTFVVFGCIEICESARPVRIAALAEEKERKKSTYINHLLGPAPATPAFGMPSWSYEVYDGPGRRLDQQLIPCARPARAQRRSFPCRRNEEKIGNCSIDLATARPEDRCYGRGSLVQFKFDAESLGGGSPISPHAPPMSRCRRSQIIGTKVRRPLSERRSKAGVVRE